MKITVINGTEKKGVTYRLKEMFLEPFRGKADITEYYLPRDCPDFCTGCASCILRGVETCKDAAYIQKIDLALRESDLIVMTSPAYVMHVTGAMKAFLDHFAYRWMPHRPAPEMFGKRAVVLTQCLGAGARSSAKDIRHSLSWWGISDIGVFTGALMEGIAWDELSEKKRRQLCGKIRRLSDRFARIDYGQPGRTSFVIKFKFLFCRVMRKKLYENGSDDLDGKYWADRGWLQKNRPWRSTVRN